MVIRNVSNEEGNAKKNQPAKNMLITSPTKQMLLSKLFFNDLAYIVIKQIYHQETH